MTSSRKWKKYIGLTGILFLFPLAWLLVFGIFGSHHFSTLPYFSPDSPSDGADTSEYSLPPFAFVSQDGGEISLDSLKNKVWLAAFYSTSSPHISKITERLLNINWKFRGEEDILIVVFSTDPSGESPDELKKYVERNTRYNEFPGKWQFLTGQDSLMQAYIRDGFFVKDTGTEAIFRLVDHNGQVRGLYGNTEYHMRNAMEDIALLKKEIDRARHIEHHENH
jgi:protein SCO1